MYLQASKVTPGSQLEEPRGVNSLANVAMQDYAKLVKAVRSRDVSCMA